MGANCGTSKGKLYNKLGLESFQNRWWYKKLSFLYKLIVNQSPYLLNVIPRNNITRSARGSNNIPLLGTKHFFFSKTVSFIQLVSIGIDLTYIFRNLIALLYSKNVILSFIRPIPNKVSRSHNPQGFKLLTRLRLGLGHLRYHKFQQFFRYH